MNLITSNLMNLHDIRKKIVRKRIENISANSVEEVFSTRTLQGNIIITSTQILCCGIVLDVVRASTSSPTNLSIETPVLRRTDQKSINRGPLWKKLLDVKQLLQLLFLRKLNLHLKLKPEVQPEEQGQAQEQVTEIEEDDQWETDAAITSIAGETLLEMLAEGQIPGVTDEGDGKPENVVKKEEEFDLEMKFND